MSESSTCDEKDLLVSYLYGECDADDRARVERHVEACVACRDELAALRDVRSQLVAWAPPDGEVDLVVPAPGPPVAAAPVRRWRASLGLAAAALLVVAAGAAVANVELAVESDRVTMSAGWSRPAPARADERAAAGSPTPPAAAPVAAGSSAPAATPEELAELERRMLEAIEAVATGTGPARLSSADRAAIVERVEAGIAGRLESMIADSEARQRRELALRMAQLTRELDTQRRGDLVRIERGLGQLEGLTGAEVARQRELLNYLVRVSQRR